MMACSSVTVQRSPQLSRPTKQKSQFACAPPMDPRPQVFLRCNVLVPCGGLIRAPGESLSQLGHQGTTAMHIAAQEGHQAVVQQLIAAGPWGVDLKTSRPKVARGARCRGLRRGTESFCGRGDFVKRGFFRAEEDSSDPFWETLFPPKNSYTDDLQIDVSQLDCAPLQIDLKTSPFSGAHKGLMLSHCRGH